MVFITLWAAMQILVLGANGLLGSNVVDTALGRGWEVAGTFHSSRPSFDVPLEQLDLRDENAVKAVLDDYVPDVVCNCAAMTDVDACESSPGTARAINAEAPATIADHCATIDSEFVHVSTDYVFDGTGETPYSEADDPNPVQAYGSSKLAGEQCVLESTATTLVPRLSFVYGVHRADDELRGFPAWVQSRIGRDEPTPLFTDQWVTPSRAGQAAATILDLLETDFRDVVHVASSSCVTPYEFGREISRQTGRGEELLEAGSRADVDRAATRPAYSCLDVTRVEDLLDREQPTIESDLEAIAPWLSLD